MFIRTRLLSAALCIAIMGGTWIPSAAQAADTKISIKDFMFAPMALTVKAGSTVTWTNKDDEPHTIFSDTGLFKSGALDTNETFSFKFDKPGTYHYLCTIHPRMLATIVVE